MNNNPHEALREYVSAIRIVVAPNDPFGQHLLGLVYRKSRVSARGIFRRVRQVRDAVLTAGGTFEDARSWTMKAIYWLRTGKAIDQKFARFEIDPCTSRAMNDLISFLQGLPADLLRPTAIGTPLMRPNPFAAKPGTQPASSSPFGARLPLGGGSGSSPTPATPSASPFGSPAPASSANPFRSQPPTPPANPFGAPAPAPPKPTSPFGGGQKPGSVFGSRSPFGQSMPDALPFHVAICFDALAVTPDKPGEDGSGISIPDWLEALSAQQIPAQEIESVDELLPADLRGLFERLHKASSDKSSNEFERILAAIGRLNDMRALDHLYNLTRDTGAEDGLMEAFTKMGSDVGVAGLVSLLPIENDKREDWLTGLYEIARRSVKGEYPLSETSLDALWKIAVAESAPNIEFCPVALRLLAATGRPESQPILWEHARSTDVRRLRAALFALAQLDPGDQLDELLAAIGSAPDLPQRFPFGSPFGSPPSATEITYIGIPFERLQAVVLGPKAKLRISALNLLGRIDDPRIVPFLITQLARRIPHIREVALNHLRRLNATEAADAVANLMDRDVTLRQRAAEILCEWDDPRCVTVLLPVITDEEAEKVIRRLGKLSHPDFDEWLMRKIERLDQEKNNESDDALTKIIDVLEDVGSQNLRAVLNKLLASPSSKVRLAVANALGKLDETWAKEALRTLLSDRVPMVSYRAATLYKEVTTVQELLTSSSEIKRILGVRLLWAEKNSVALHRCLSDPSAAIRDTALWALADLRSPDAVDMLRCTVEKEDRVDLWNINRAVIAWRGLAKMGALPTSGRADQP